MSSSPTRPTTSSSNAYSTDELAALLADVGFVDVRVIGGYDGAPLGPDHRFAVFEARASQSVGAPIRLN